MNRRSGYPLSAAVVVVAVATALAASWSSAAKVSAGLGPKLFRSTAAQVSPLSMTGGAGRAETGFTMSASEDSEFSAALVGFSSDAKAPKLGLALVLRRSAELFTSTTLRLEAAPGILPKALIADRGSRGAWGAWESTTLTDGLDLNDADSYTASLGYDAAHRQISVRLGTKGSTAPLWEGYYPVSTLPKALYPMVAAAGGSKSKAPWQLTSAGTAVVATYKRASKPGPLSSQQMAFIDLGDAAEDEASVYSGTSFSVTTSGVAMALPGSVKVEYLQSGKVKGSGKPLPHLSAKGWVLESTVPRLLPGRYIAQVVYAEPGVRVVMAERPMAVISGTFNAVVRVADERPWVTEGKISGVLGLSYRKLLKPVNLVLESRPFGASDARWTKVWQSTWAKTGTKGEGELTFSYKAPQAERSEELRVHIDGQAGLRLASKVRVDRREFWVSPQGRDGWSGRRPEPNSKGSDGPFATLSGARDAVRRAIASGDLPKGGITVWVRGGKYQQLEPLSLIAEDSGTPGSPITYRASPGEQVYVQGGRVVTGFKPYKDGILVADLGVEGLGPFEYYVGMEVFYRGARQQMARWPNRDKADERGGPWEYVAKADGISTDRFGYAGDRPSTWKKTAGAMVNIWPDPNWTDNLLPLDSAALGSHEMVLGGQTSWPIKPGRRFAVLGVFEELDSPGEWYYDQEANLLYLYPEGDVGPGDVMASDSESGLLVSGASNVTVSGITFECFRGTALQVSGGTNVRIAGCTIRNTGALGVTMDGCTGSGVVGCDIYDTGRGGIALGGGDRASLTPGGNYAENNHIHHFGRVVKCYQAGIGVAGVGNRVSHNLIHDGPHNAILLWGNEHIIEYNEIHHVCMEGADSGAFYMGRDWSQQGNILRYNYFHDIGGYGLENEASSSPPWRYEAPHAAWAIYLDDCSSGTTVLGNLFVRVPLGAVMIGGGRDNVVTNNVIVESSPAVHLDARWDGYDYSDAGETKVNLDRSNYTEPPYSTRYPNLLKIYDVDPRLPVGNSITRNIISYSDDNWRGSWNMSKGKGNAVLWEFQNYDPGSMVVDNNLIWHDAQPIRVDVGAYKKGGSVQPLAKWQGLGFDKGSQVADPGFVNAGQGDYRLAEDSPAIKMGFAPLPTSQMGLYASESRATWPVARDERRDGTTVLKLSVSPGKDK